MIVIGKHLEFVLREMSGRVGCDYDTHNWREPYQYQQYTWTKEEEIDFINWMTEYLYNNSRARRELMSIPRKNKKFCKEASQSFVYNYGWSCARTH